MDTRESNLTKLRFSNHLQYVIDPYEQGKGWKLMYLWVPRMVEHLRDNAKLEFKSKSR